MAATSFEQSCSPSAYAKKVFDFHINGRSRCLLCMGFFKIFFCCSTMQGHWGKTREPPYSQSGTSSSNTSMVRDHSVFYCDCSFLSRWRKICTFCVSTLIARRSALCAQIPPLIMAPVNVSINLANGAIAEVNTYTRQCGFFSFFSPRLSLSTPPLRRRTGAFPSRLCLFGCYSCLPSQKIPPLFCTSPPNMMKLDVTRVSTGSVHKTVCFPVRALPFILMLQERKEERIECSHIRTTSCL